MGSTQPSEVSKGPQRSLSLTEFKPLIASALPLIRMETPSPKPTRESRPKSVVMIDPVETVTTKSNLQRRSKRYSYTCTSVLISVFLLSLSLSLNFLPSLFLYVFLKTYSYFSSSFLFLQTVRKERIISPLQCLLTSPPLLQSLMMWSCLRLPVLTPLRD